MAKSKATRSLENCILITLPGTNVPLVIQNDFPRNFRSDPITLGGGGGSFVCRNAESPPYFVHIYLF